MNRNPIWDIFKGILILCFIVGHTIDAPIIYQFHMPLFFVCGGVLFKRPDEIGYKWCYNKLLRFYIPYFMIYIILVIFKLIPLKWKDIVYLFYGGRVLSHEVGVWWFTGCMFATNMIVALLTTRFKRTTNIYIVLVFYFLAFIESRYWIPNTIDMPIWYRYPFNIDVCLLSVPLFYLGYLLKEKIVILEHSKYLIAVCVGIIFIFEIIIFKYHFIEYEVDMKYSRYCHPLIFIIMVLAWGIIIYEMSNVISKFSLSKSFFVALGQLSYPIMFLHVPIIYFLKKYSFLTSIYIIVITLFFCFFVSLLLNSNKYTKSLFITGNFEINK